MLTIGSVCSGYGGLDMALMAIFDAELAWYSDIDDGAVRIMSHHHPGLPNLGDLTTCDWIRVQRVDIFTAGYPCQPFSHAGKRKGADDERHLWPHIREAIRVLRPRLVVLENVAGHRSMGADRVLGDMAEDGLHVRWISVRASDVGCDHQRERWFCLAHPEGESWEQWYRDTRPPADARSEHGPERRIAASPEAASGRALGEPAGRGGVGTLLPTPTTQPDTGNGHARNLGREVALLPTPMANEAEKAGQNPRHSDGQEYLTHAIHSLLPTPRATDHHDSMTAAASRRHVADGNGTLPETDWGKYAAGIRRQELAFGRPAPCPVQPSSKGTPQLAPVFTEWLMALPEGHVTNPAIWEGMTDAKGKPASKAAIRNAQLHALGNGVVPPQAEYAVRAALSWRIAESLGAR